jgi:hypothetical protein
MFKMSNSLGVIWNCDHVLKWNEKSGKIYAFLKIHSFSKMINKKNVTYWGNCKCDKLQVAKDFIWKILFMKNMFFDKRTSKGQ